MPEVSFQIQGRNVAAAELLLAEVRQRVRDGKPIPDAPNAAKLSEMRVFSHVAGARTRAAADTTRAAVGNALDYPGRQLSRSKRKVVATLSGVAIGAPASVGIGIAIGVAAASGPIGWAIGGAMLFAAASALAAYSLRHAVRNARAWYYGKYAVPEFLAGIANPAAADQITTDVANGVRYWLQKRKLSAIADEIRDLNQAFTDWDREKNRTLRRCHDCVKVAEAFEKVVFQSIKLERDMEVFTKFFAWIQGQIQRVYVTSPHAFTDANINASLKWAHRHVADPNNPHVGCGGNWDGFGSVCYEPDDSGKPVKPKVSTLRPLSAEMRRPFVRLTNDAAYLCQHGEDTAMAAYHDSQEYIEGLLPPLSETTYTALRTQRSAPAAAGENFDALAHDAPETPWAEKAAQGGGMALGLGVVAGGANVGLQAAILEQAAAEVGRNAISAGVGLGIGTVRAVVAGVAEAYNTHLEFAALHQETHRLGAPNLDRMVIALRTILKDNKFFENCVDELAKLRTYHDEFEKTFRGVYPSCGQIFERVYRCFKAAKHAKNLNLYFAHVKLFAEQAELVRNRADTEFGQEQYDALCAKIDRFITLANHATACTDNYCYAGRDASSVEEMAAPA